MEAGEAPRLQEVDRIKEQGNSKFKEGAFFEAKCLYSGALEMLERCCLHQDKADAAWVGLKNNIALCDFKREEWTRVIDVTTEVLAREPANTKALYRRGVAQLGSGRQQAARSDLRRVLELEPGNAEARQKLVELSRQSRAAREASREQAARVRGFLAGERLDAGIALCEDGGVRKLQSNEHDPVLASWIKREWLDPDSGLVGVVSAHVVMRTEAGQELLSSRKAEQKAAEPCRWVIDDSYVGVFKGWNVAAKSSQLKEISRFEVARYTMDPSIEGTIQRCMERWVPDGPERRELAAAQGLSEEQQEQARRGQAAQILSLPEAFCTGAAVGDPQATLSLELEVLEAAEYADVHLDGRVLLRVLAEGKARTPTTPVVTDLATVAVHFRVAKFLSNHCLHDTRAGLAEGSGGMSTCEDFGKEPRVLVVGEEDAGDSDDFVPPCIGRCLMLPPRGVVEGMRFELILRDGVPLSDLDQNIRLACAEGLPSTLPDTTGPVHVRIEVRRVEPPLQGPSTPGWEGLPSLRQEAQRAEELELMEGGRHRAMALRRWRRVLAWLGQLLRARRWQLQASDGAADADGTMYDLEWDDEESDGDADPGGPGGPPTTTGLDEAPLAVPAVEDDNLRQLEPEELEIWAAAHAAAARLVLCTDSDGAALCQRHARSVLQAASIGRVPTEAEVSARSTLSARLIDAGEAAEALKVLQVACQLDPSSTALKDACALAYQRDQDTKATNVRVDLRRAKQELSAALEADHAERLLELLRWVDEMPLTWEVASESAIGKEVGRCAKHADGSVVDCARAIVAKLHKLAKAERPMWVR